jgi:hypothetical protein
VLAVGDHEFQQRVLARVASLVADGTTLLLVTHDPRLALGATTRAIWLDCGEVRGDGATSEVLVRYEADVHGWTTTLASSPLHVERLDVEPDGIEPGGSVRVAVRIRADAPVDDPTLRVELRPAAGTEAAWMRDPQESPEERHLNLLASTRLFPLGRLDAGLHTVEVELERVSVTATLLELSVVLGDSGGRVLDDASAQLAVGDGSDRPYYLLRVVPDSRDVGGEN